MTHAERQAFLKTSRLGQVLGVAHLLPEVANTPDKAPEDFPRLKRVRGLFKRGKVGNKQVTSTDTEVSKNGN
ncbi:hypothetical protein [Chlorogloeopsis sp. ULAP02]|uniref:hypothetical protein n=1 Tax=Chlorogloeopsis sp. ULAP02 TaxID=3107926 RepID=UPI00398B4028